MTKETAYKWAAVLWFFAAGMWIVSALTSGPSSIAQFSILGIVNLAAGIMFVRSWRRQREVPRRVDGRRSPVLEEPFLLLPAVVLVVPALSLISASLLPLVKLFS
jgi:hypothetical protein